MINCEHKHIRKNYPFGKKSKPVMFCKDCGEVITNKFLADRKTKQAKQKRRGKRWTIK